MTNHLNTQIFHLVYALPDRTTHLAPLKFHLLQLVKPWIAYSKEWLIGDDYKYIIYNNILHHQSEKCKIVSRYGTLLSINFL